MILNFCSSSLDNICTPASDFMWWQRWKPGLCACQAKALPHVPYISSPQNRNFKRTIKGVGGHLLQRLLVFKTLINFKEFPYCCTSENDAFKTEMSSIMTETNNSNLNSMLGSVLFYSNQNDRIKVYIQSCYCNWGLKCHFCAGYFSGFVFNIHSLHVVLWAGRES